jgi:hypothetical protein
MGKIQRQNTVMCVQKGSVDLYEKDEKVLMLEQQNAQQHTETKCTMSSWTIMTTHRMARIATQINDTTSSSKN